MPQRDIIPKKVAKLRTDVDYLLYQNSQGGGSSSLFPVTGTGTAAGNVIANIGTNVLSIQSAGNDFLSVDPTAGSETSFLRAYNTTADDNISSFLAETQNTQAAFTILANFNNGIKSVGISGQADATTAEIDYLADLHHITGNVGIGVAPTVLFQVQSGGNNFLSIDPTAGAEVSQMRVYNTTANGNFSQVRLETLNTEASANLYATFNNGVKEASIFVFANTTESYIDYNGDFHEFTGNIVLSGGLSEYADDAAAAVGGIVVGQLYRTGSIVKIRVA